MGAASVCMTLTRSKVELPGIEPGSSGAETGLLRVQFV